jgi:hypothetical protein
MPNGMRCNNLEIVGIPGSPGASRCRVYKERYPGLSIMLIDLITQKVTGLGACAHGSVVDDLVIMPHIGKGCSLRVEP